MSREIKFRAWNGLNMQQDPSILLEIDDGTIWVNETQDETCDFLVSKDTYILMQYTGLKDIAGTEAYEKDYDEDGNMIDWCEKCCGYQFFQIDIPTKDVIHCQNCEGNFMVQDHIPEFKIIGNMYENQPPDHVPELHPK